MDKLTILNIPNYYCSYFLLGFGQIAKLRFAPQKEFSHLNNLPFLVIEYRGKIAVIENDDPLGCDKKAYDLSDVYFATNKLLSRDDYNLPKVKPIYPHYSINNGGQYLNLFGLKGIKEVGLKEFVRQYYILIRRPNFDLKPARDLEGNYVFFSGNIWKKEDWANRKRAAYIQACRNNPLIEFEGGMVPRTDGDLCGLPPDVLNRKYTPKEFAEKSSRSIIGFSNPAVLNAVSWRLGEYLNYGCFVISYKFKIDLPMFPEHGKEIHYLDHEDDFADVLDYAMKNPEYRKKVARGGKAYFEKNCLPHIQANRILSFL